MRLAPLLIVVLAACSSATTRRDAPCERSCTFIVENLSREGIGVRVDRFEVARVNGRESTTFLLPRVPASLGAVSLAQPDRRGECRFRSRTADQLRYRCELRMTSATQPSVKEAIGNSGRRPPVRGGGSAPTPVIPDSIR